MTPIDLPKLPKISHNEKMLAIRDVFLDYEYENDYKIFFFIRMQVRHRYEKLG